MAVPVIESYSISSVNEVPVSIPMPSGLTTGDLCIIGVANDDATATAQWDDSTLKPTGFTLINEAGDATPDTHCAMFWRIIDGTESWPISCPAQSANDIAGFALRISGAHATTPIHQVGADNNNGSATTHAITGVTTTVNDCLILGILAGDGGDVAPLTVTNFTEIVENSFGAGSQLASVMAYKNLATAGASGTMDVEFTGGGGADGASGFTVAIAPAEAASGTTISAAVDTLSLTENAATVSLDVAISAAVDTFTISELAATVGLGKSVETTLSMLTLSELQAGISLDVAIATALETLTLQEFAAQLALGKTIGAAAASLGLTVYASDISLDVSIAAGLDNLTVTELAAGVSLVSGTAISASVAALNITAYSATITGTTLATSGPAPRGFMITVGRLLG